MKTNLCLYNLKSLCYDKKYKIKKCLPKIYTNPGTYYNPIRMLVNSKYPAITKLTNIAKIVFVLMIALHCQDK